MGAIVILLAIASYAVAESTINSGLFDLPIIEPSRFLDNTPVNSPLTRVIPSIPTNPILPPPIPTETNLDLPIVTPSRFLEHTPINSPLTSDIPSVPTTSLIPLTIPTGTTIDLPINTPSRFLEHIPIDSGLTSVIPPAPTTPLLPITIPTGTALDLPILPPARFFEHTSINSPVTNVVPSIPTTPILPPTVVPTSHSRDTDIISQYVIRDLRGQVMYGHVEPGQRHAAFQDALGNKIGGFSYIDNEGILRQTGYIADQYGYRVVSNSLPVAPLPVEDTPEVKAAKLQHLDLLQKLSQLK